MAFKPNAYFVPSVGAGLSLRLEAVQVLRASGGAMGFSDYGFSASASEETITEVPSTEDF